MSHEIKTILLDNEGYVINTIITNSKTDFEALKNIYNFETYLSSDTSEIDLHFAETGDKYDFEEKKLLKNYYQPCNIYDENNKFVIDKSRPWIGHPDYVEEVIIESSVTEIQPTE